MLQHAEKNGLLLSFSGKRATSAVLASWLATRHYRRVADPGSAATFGIPQTKLSRDSNQIELAGGFASSSPICPARQTGLYQLTCALVVLWKDYRSGALTEKDLETAAFNVFLYGRMIGAAAEIDDHLNRGRNMDTRTPLEQCAFVV